MINNSQLQIWSNPPSQTEMTRIQNAYNYIKGIVHNNFNVEAISLKHWLTNFKKPNIYLQWSYANKTNISFESDVDIVVEIEDPYYSDVSYLSEQEIIKYKYLTKNSNYRYEDLKNDLLESLKSTFWSTLLEWNKCLVLEENTNRCKADIIPCFQHKIYTRFPNNHSDSEFVKWIKFYGSNCKEIVNFPKIHLKNCSIKNKSTKWNFKSIVRIFKFIKSKLVENSDISEDITTSYYIENLLYNIPNHAYSWDLSTCMNNILNFIILRHWNLSSFYCANEIDDLFSDKNWTVENAVSFINMVADYYKYN